MFKHWAYDPTRKTYTGTYEMADHLPSGLYRLMTNSYQQPVATGLELRQDTMVSFECGPLPGVMAEIDRFWGSAAHYKRLGVSHKRGILLYGPPGCGKTGIVSVIIEETIKRNGIVFQVGHIDSFKSGIVLARQIEQGRPIVAILEDIENIIANDEETLLEVMDGASSTGDGILFLATTNNLAIIPPRVRCRPSRIDTLIEIGFPEPQQRYEYLKFLLSNKEVSLGENLAKQWTQETKDFSLAMLKELVIAVQIYGKSVKEAVTTLRQMANDATQDEEDEDN